MTEHSADVRPERVRDIGEFALIERLARQLSPAVGIGSSVPLGIGDDAAVWQPEAGNAVVVTTDALVEGVHFRLDWTDWFSLGHKMLAVNVSDIAAMGATPRLATIALGVTGEESLVDLDDLYRGIDSLAGPYGVVVAGGDVVRSPHGLVMSVTLLGEVPPHRVVSRKGAKPGDLVVVSGTLGASAAGMRLLQHPRDAASADLLVASHLRPVPRVALGQLMHDAGVTAAMDLSDGLLGDLHKIVVASGAAADIAVDDLPVLPAVRALFPDAWPDLALRGGEDYELLMTVPPDAFPVLRQRAEEIGATVTAVGRVREPDSRPLVRVIRDGREVSVPGTGHDHFLQQ